MKKRKIKKLQLSRETIKVQNEANVAGGITGGVMCDSVYPECSLDDSFCPNCGSYPNASICPVGTC